MIMVRILLPTIRHHLVVGSLEPGKTYEGSLAFDFFFVALTGTSSHYVCILFLTCTFLASVKAQNPTDSAKENPQLKEREGEKKRATG